MLSATACLSAYGVAEPRSRTSPSTTYDTGVRRVTVDNGPKWTVYLAPSQREGIRTMLTAATDTTIAKGWQTLDEEVVIDDVPVEGALPAWLEGTLVRNGPAKFDGGVRHWLHRQAHPPPLP